MALVLAAHDRQHHGEMWLFEKEPASGQWVRQAGPWPVLLGKRGLAWGRGLHERQEGLQKTEGDDKTPAGRFRIGAAMGPAATLPPGAKEWPYQQITAEDAWIEDPRLPHYNRLVRVKQNPKPAWFEKQRMDPTDPAYKWEIIIEHNYPKPVPWKGSAIFFHLRRGPDVPSAGCVTMAEPDIERFLLWLDPAKKPQVVILAWKDYMRLKRDWNLPDVGQR